MYKLFLLLILFPIIVNATERVYIVRHCDKSNRISNPCCSALGYERAFLWAEYLSNHLASTNIHFINAGTSSPKQCVVSIIVNNTTRNSDGNTIHNDNLDLNYSRDFRCQRSERLLLTTHQIRQNLKYPSTIEGHYCVGNPSKVVKAIYEASAEDVILVWEHTEILEILSLLGWNLGKWPDQDHYNVIFMVDLKNKKLYYDIVNLYRDPNITNSNSDLKYHTWLSNYSFIPPVNRAIVVLTDTNFSVLKSLFYFGCSLIGALFLVQWCRRVSYTRIN
jgi:hypothetical protein